MDYHTGNMHRMFSRKRDASSDSQQQLHCMTSTQQPCSHPDTTMLISADPVVQHAELRASAAAPDAASSAPKYLQLDYSSFLFMRPSYSCYHWHGGHWKGETLKCCVMKQDMGRVYTHGVFICAEPELQGLGFNYLGCTAYMTTELGVTKDRSHIETRYLFGLLPLLLSFARREHPQQYDLMI